MGIRLSDYINDSNIKMPETEVQRVVKDYFNDILMDFLSTHFTEFLEEELSDFNNVDSNIHYKPMFKSEAKEVSKKEAKYYDEQNILLKKHYQKSSRLSQFNTYSVSYQKVAA